MDNDASRALTPTGHTQNCTVARQWIERLERMPICFCSPYLRARQTADDLQALIPELEFQSRDWLVPSTAAVAVLEELVAITERGSGTQAVAGTANGTGARNGARDDSSNTGETDILLVGHNPVLSEVWNLLLEGEGYLRFGLSTSHLVCIDSTVFAPACGSFIYTVTP